MNNESLAKASTEFIEGLNNVFSKIWNKEPFYLLEKTGEEEVARSHRITLTKISKSNMLSGEFGYTFSLDRESRYLSVQESFFKFFLGDDSEPLFRYDFVKKTPNIPRAHVQFHLDRNHPDRDRIADLVRGEMLSKVHFPLGGEFFRPCLEDVLLTCNHDLGISLNKDDKNLLLERVKEFRMIQAKAIYREYLASEFGPLGTEG